MATANNDPAPPLVAPAPPPDIELPACFYLGREYDLAGRRALDQPVMYDARDLTTHGVVVGMTGSGKTGLCISLLEEAALDRIPCIIIDPKGDLTNLLLQFPELNPRISANGSTPRTPGARACPWKTMPGNWPRTGAKAWPSGTRTRSASPGCGIRRNGGFTPRGARRACPCPSCKPLPRPEGSSSARP